MFGPYLNGGTTGSNPAKDMVVCVLGLLCFV